MNKNGLNRCRRILFLGCLFLGIIKGFTQDSLIQWSAEQRAEEITDSERDWSMWEADWEYLEKHPLPLQVENLEHLLEYGLLSDIQVFALKEHIQKSGPLKSWYELQVLDAFTWEEVQRLMHFACLVSVEKINWKSILKEGISVFSFQWKRRLQLAKGFEGAGEEAFNERPSFYYIGDPNRVFMKYRWRWRQTCSFGVLAEKDAGETFASIDSLGKPAGFDFYSAHLAFKPGGKIRQVLIGDFVGNLGYGPDMGAFMARNNTADIFGLKNKTYSFRPHTGADEYRFNRGVGMIAGNKRWEVKSYLSHKSIDVNVQNGLDIADDVVKYMDGQHGNLSALGRKNSGKETLAGCSSQFFLPQGFVFSTGMHVNHLGVGERLSGIKELISNKGLSWRPLLEVCISQFIGPWHWYWNNLGYTGINGKSQWGTYYMADEKNIFFLEGSVQRRDSKNLPLTENYAASSLSDFGQIQLAWQFRYSAKVVSFMSYGRGSNTNPKVWLSTEEQQRTHWTWRLQYDFSKKSGIYFWARLQEKWEAVLLKQNQLVFRRFNLRCQVQGQFSREFKWTVRWEKIACKNYTTFQQGYLLYMQLERHALDSPWRWCSRWTLFDAPDFQSAIYAYEPEIPGFYTVAPRYGQGNAAVFLCSRALGKYLEWHFRYAASYRAGVSAWSVNSPEETKGPWRTEISSRLEFKF